jgi:hypothetical protein
MATAFKYCDSTLMRLGDWVAEKKKVKKSREMPDFICHRAFKSWQNYNTTDCPSAITFKIFPHFFYAQKVSGSSRRAQTSVHYL